MLSRGKGSECEQSQKYTKAFYSQMLAFQNSCFNIFCKLIIIFQGKCVHTWKVESHICLKEKNRPKKTLLLILNSCTHGIISDCKVQYFEIIFFFIWLYFLILNLKPIPNKQFSNRTQRTLYSGSEHISNLGSCDSAKGNK